MVFGLGKIGSNISNTVGTLQGVLNKVGAAPYTQFAGVTSQIIPSNWKLSLPYSFKIESAGSAIPGGITPKSGGFLSAVGDFFKGGLFDEFVLPINPEELKQSEPFAILISPTQRGVISEHNGIVFKDLSISGTTGQRLSNQRTGYEVFIQLRNFFRSYGQLKKDPTNRNTQLLFINRKDNETLIVEPTSFNLDRTKEAPFLYRYNIIFRVLGLRQPILAPSFLGNFFGKFINTVNKVNELISNTWGTITSNIQILKGIGSEYKAAILFPYERTRLAFKSYQNKSFNLSDLTTNIKTQLSTKTIVAFLSEAKTQKQNGSVALATTKIPVDIPKFVDDNGYRALSIIPTEAQEDLPISFLSVDESSLLRDEIDIVKKTTKQEYQTYLDDLLSFIDDASEKFNILPTGYNEFIGRSNAFSVDPNKQIQLNELDTLEALQKIQLVYELILANNFIFNDTINTFFQNVRNNYDGNLSIDTPTSVDEIYLPSNKTLEDLAAEYLGTAERWIEIALVNNLLPPYIDEASTTIRVKKSGDKILIPRFGSSNFSQLPKTREIRISEDFTEIERNLGVDLRLNSDFDLILDTNNDFKLIGGSENAGQAIILKLVLDKGSLKYYPQLGCGTGIGEKIRNGMDIRDDLINSILSDTRFENIKDLSFIAENSTIKVNFNLILKYVATPIPISFNV